MNCDVCEKLSGNPTPCTLRRYCTSKNLQQPAALQWTTETPDPDKWYLVEIQEVSPGTRKSYIALLGDVCCKTENLIRGYIVIQWAEIVPPEEHKA